MEQHLGAPSITPLRGFLLVHENSQVAVGGSHRRAASATGRNGPTFICAAQLVERSSNRFRLKGAHAFAGKHLLHANAMRVDLGALKSLAVFCE